MKLVFTNLAEQRKTKEIVENASSISNSLSLIDLVKDSVVDGSEPEPVVEEKKSQEPEYKTLADLVEKARGMGISMDFENASRAGVLKAIEEFEMSKPKPEPEAPVVELDGEQGSEPESASAEEDEVL